MAFSKLISACCIACHLYSAFCPGAAQPVPNLLAFATDVVTGYGVSVCFLSLPNAMTLRPISSSRRSSTALSNRVADCGLSRGSALAQCLSNVGPTISTNYRLRLNLIVPAGSARVLIRAHMMMMLLLLLLDQCYQIGQNSASG
jgi:hypothetical protein